VDLNFYMRSDNMHFNHISGAGLPTKRTIISASKILSQNPVSRFDLNESTANEQNISTLHFGEEPFSFRVALKRYSTFSAVALGYVAAFDAGTISVNNIPLFSPTIANPSVNFNVSILGFIRPAYLGLRGSARIKSRSWSNSNVNQDPMSSVIVRQVTAGTYTVDSGTISTSLTNCYLNTIGGVVYYPTSNGGIEFEAPLYTNNSFVFACDSELGQATDFPDTGVYESAWNRKSEVIYFSNGVSGTGNYLLDWAAGEDFMLMRFMGSPWFTTV